MNGREPEVYLIVEQTAISIDMGIVTKEQVTECLVIVTLPLSERQPLSDLMTTQNAKSCKMHQMLAPLELMGGKHVCTPPVLCQIFAYFGGFAYQLKHGVYYLVPEMCRTFQRCDAVPDQA